MKYANLRLLSQLACVVAILDILIITEGAIHRRRSRKDLSLQSGGIIDGPVEEILKEVEGMRPRRAAGDPTFSRSELNDGHLVAQIRYSGQVNSEVIFLLTYDLSDGAVTSSNVYRSTDYGNTFDKISSRVGHGATLLNNIFTSPTDYTRVFFVDAFYARIYVSQNEGVSFTTRALIPSTISPTTLLFHPTEEEWILAHDPVNSALYVSRDFGNTPFIKIVDNVKANDRFQWGDISYDSDTSTVYYMANGVLYTQQYPYDESTKKIFDPLIGSHDDFLIIDRYIFLQKTVGSGIGVNLWVSADRQPFQQAQIPSTYGHQRYIVDSIRSLQALVIIQHTNNQYNLYLSEEQGVYFYQSLSDIAVEPRTTQVILGRFIIDLEVVESMNYTTYIANQNIGTTYKRTLISFDAGANWNKIKPPGNNSYCQLPQCSLHLHMLTSDYWRTAVYSQASAPGIIIAHGSTGSYLADNHIANLFISLDGGSTWSLTLGGTWLVRVLDHGGLIVAARDHYSDENLSRTLMYTCNEGLSWSPLTFTSNEINVFGILTEPGETTTVLSIFGVESVNWVVVVVDFATIFSSTCGPNDYYNWMPFDQYADTGCLLGASVTIELRKPEVCCLNGNTYNRVIGYSLCDCTIEDYECDYGYKHANGFSGPCIRDEDITLNISACSNGEISYFSWSQGYRKIAGDVCSGGIEKSFTPLNFSCCYAAGSRSRSGSDESSQYRNFFIGFVIVLVLLIISILFTISLVIFCIRRSGSQRSNPPTYHNNPHASAAGQSYNDNSRAYSAYPDNTLEAETKMRMQELFQEEDLQKKGFYY